MKIEYLREFAAVGKYLNFSKAAEELFISQSSLSRHIFSMEEELGQKLLKRDTHSVELTEIGESVLPYCRMMTEQYDSMLGLINRLAKGTNGRLSLAQSNYAAERYVDPLLLEFLKQYPHVTVDTLPCAPHDALKAVLDGRTDLALFVYYNEPADPQLVYHEIAREKCFFCLPESHHLADRPGLTMSDLNGENLFLIEQDSSYLACIEQHLAAYHVFPKKRINLESVANLSAAFRLENAIGIEPEHISDHPHRGLVYLPILDADIYARIAFIHLPGNSNPALKLFLDTAFSDNYRQYFSRK